MASKTTGVLVPFRAPRRQSVRTRTIATPGCQAVPVLDAGDEAQRNAAWDELLRLAIHAWSWRDPESLANLRGQLGTVSAEVELDWKS